VETSARDNQLAAWLAEPYGTFNILCRVVFSCVNSLDCARHVARNRASRSYEAMAHLAGPTERIIVFVGCIKRGIYINDRSIRVTRRSVYGYALRAPPPRAAAMGGSRPLSHLSGSASLPYATVV
jgi:hypothetical protein